MTALAVVALAVALAALALVELAPVPLQAIGLGALVAAFALAAVEVLRPTHVCVCPCHDDGDEQLDEPAVEVLDGPVDDLRVGRITAGVLPAELVLHGARWPDPDPLDRHADVTSTTALPVVEPALAIPAPRPYLDHGRHRAAERA